MYYSFSFRHDLEWWADYIRILPIQQLSQTFRSTKTEDANSPIESPSTDDAVSSPTVNLHLELNGFQCVLRVRDGPVIVVGIETAGLKCDHVSFCGVHV
jgi:hypothetical protein